MASRALQAIRRTVTVDWPRQHQEGAKAHLIAVARAGHAKIMAHAAARGAMPTFEAYANSPGREIETVVLPGPIVYRYRYLRDVIATALDELRKASPVLSGEYVRSHTLYVNGIPTETIPQTIKLTDEIFIANPVPYSRKLEIGKTESGRDFLISVPNRIYERVAKNKLVPRYRNVAKISFGYITPPDAYKLVKNNPARSWLKNKKRWYYAPGQRADRAAGAAVRSPAIFIEKLT